MMTLKVKGRVKKATLEAVVIRADGTREDLGLLGYTSSNPLKRWAVNLFLFFKDIKRRIKK